VVDHLEETPLTARGVERAECLRRLELRDIDDRHVVPVHG